jgi:hypothetical protein
MSGVAGADRVKSRQDFKQFLASYQQLISKFPGFISLQPSGSYNSNPDKMDFGDIDLIVHIQSTKDKAAVKKELQAFFHNHPDTVIVPFSSEKHAGKRSYNAGELVSVRYHDDALGYSVQIDNIVALDQTEASFKQEFLDLPAEKQGLILGLVKIAAIETQPQVLFKRLGITARDNLEPNQEYEFNLSSVELQLRLVTYEPGTYKQSDRQVLWTSRSFDDLKKLLYQYKLDADFDSLLLQAKQTIKNPRSNARMEGVFSSMITVKSGEVGTAKGAGKEAALAKIQQTFKEHRSLFRSLLEADTARRVVFAFVRFQPPTIGHELLINTVKKTAEQYQCPYVIYVSRKQDHKENPLGVETKIQYLNMMFPGTNFVAAGPTTRTPIEAAVELNQKYTDLILVAGSDRESMFNLLQDYNHKNYEYNSIDFVSAGERDPDSPGVAGISGTKMREAAVANDFATFQKGLPDSISAEGAQQLMSAVAAGLQKPARAKKGVAEGSQEINWVKPNFDFEWHEVEEQSRMKQVPVDVRQYYQKHFPNKDAWLKAVQNGKAVVVPPDHAYEIRNAPFDKASLQKVLAPTGHEGPIGPAKEKRVNDLFDKGQVEMPIILKTSQGLWLIGGKTRLGTANYVKGLPAKVWLISGKQGVAESLSPGEYHVWTVHFDDGGKGNIRVPSDEVSGDSIKRFYNKQGKNVVHIDYDWGVYSNDSPWTPKKLMHEPGGIEVDPLEGVAGATPKKLKTGPAAHFTPKDKHVKVGQFVGGMEESKSVNCIPLSEHVENIMGALINKIIVNEAIQNNRK